MPDKNTPDSHGTNRANPNRADRDRADANRADRDQADRDRAGRAAGAGFERIAFGGAGRGDSDADLGARLERALRAEHGDAHVDVAELLRGTRRRAARHSRSRRVALVAAAAVAVGAVPVAYQAVQWASSPVVPAPSELGPAAGGSPAPPAVPVPTPTDTAPEATPTGPAGPAVSFPTITLPREYRDDLSKTMYDFPDAIGFDAADLPLPMVVLNDGGQYRGIPTVNGQMCNDSRFKKSPQPVAGRSWLWAEESSNRFDQVTVSLNVTGWTHGTGEREMTNVVENSGSCRFADDVREITRRPDLWIGWTERETDGMPEAYAAQLLEGDVIVSVAVGDPAGRKSAVTRAQALLTIATERVAASGLGALPTIDANPQPPAGASTGTP